MKNTRLLFVILALVGMTLACNIALDTGAEPTPVVIVVTQAATDTAISQPVLQPTDTETPTAEPTLEPTVGPTSTASAPVVTPLKDPVNCRFGPSVLWEQVYALKVGEYMPVVGKSADGSWWLTLIPNTTDKTCWVGASVTTISGDQSALQVVPPPQAFITDVQLRINEDFANLGKDCAVGPFPTFVVKGRIYANGPLEIAWTVQTQQDGFREEHGITFKQFGYQDISFTYVPSVWKKGNFWIRVAISKPKGIANDVAYEIQCK